MPRDQRKALIEKLEGVRESRVLAYVTGDRPPAGAQIGEDAVRPFHDQLRAIGHVPKLDLFIYSRGGALEVPWRLASALREAADEWNTLVPFRANSAATLLALGGDEIVLGKHGELGPIDPIFNVQQQGTQLQDAINVEDVMAYLDFVRENVGLTDQQALTAGLASLTGRLDAVSLGGVYRVRSHIRDVAFRMLGSRRDPSSERVMETIVETLAERVYAHGHAIGLSETEDIGLPVTKAEDETDTAMWELFQAFESDLKIREPLDPIVAVAGNDRYMEDATIAIIETTDHAAQFSGELEVRANRQLPPQLSVAMNLNVQLPPNLAPENVGPQMQALLQQFQQQLAQDAQAAVQEALKQQAPLVGAEVGLRGFRWVRAD